METLSIQKKYFNPELEEELKIKLNEIEFSIKEDNKELAHIGLPKSQGDSINRYFGKYHHQIQGLIDYSNQTLQSRSIVGHVNDHSKHTKKVVQTRISGISEKKNEANKLESKLVQKSTLMTFKKLVTIHLIIALIGLCEAMFSVQIFESFGFSRLEAILVSLLYGVVLTTYAHLAPLIINFGKTILQKRLIAGVLVFFTIVFFYYLADSRATYLKELAQSEGIQLEYSPLPFVCMSTLILIVAIALAYFFLPDKKEREKIRDHKILTNQKNEIANQISQNQKDIESIEYEHTTLRVTSISRLEYGASLEDFLTTQSQYLFYLFISENQKNREDSCDCYDDTYTLKFNYYFKPLLNI